MSLKMTDATRKSTQLVNIVHCAIMLLMCNTPLGTQLS